jgi:hypothetical protein
VCRENDPAGERQVGAAVRAVLAAAASLARGSSWWLSGWLRAGRSPLIARTLGGFSTYGFRVLLPVARAMVVQSVCGAPAGPLAVLLDDAARQGARPPARPGVGVAHGAAGPVWRPGQPHVLALPHRAPLTPAPLRP